jgi:hypothetical protein
MPSRTTICLVLVSVLLVSDALQLRAQDWKRKIEAHEETLIRKDGSGTDARLKAELLAMADTDQEVRKRWLAASPEKRAPITAEMLQTDKDKTARLKTIVDAQGWPTISLVGLEASRAAALILIHSPDHDFQRRLLPGLQKLVDQDKILGAEIADVIDKVLVAEGKAQRFGTQFDYHNDQAVLLPIEDPGHLDERRAQYGLTPMAVYKKLLVEKYHMKPE